MLYYPHDGDKEIESLLATQVEDFLCTGIEKRMRAFEQFFKDTFEASRLARFHLEPMWCVIIRNEDGSIKTFAEIKA